VIRFAPGAVPPGFDAQVRAPGEGWLAAHPSGRPPDRWSAFKDFKVVVSADEV
jgi:hypothetical protein